MNGKLFWYRVLVTITTFLTILLVLRLLRGEENMTVDPAIAVVDLLLIVVRQRVKMALKMPNRFLDSVSTRFQKKTD
jgi:hypothetical protein